MHTQRGSDAIKDWPEESREPAQLVIDKYGAREYYAKEFLDFRRKKPTPYMDQLRFEPRDGTGDPDGRLLSDQDLKQAVEEGNEEERTQ